MWRPVGGSQRGLRSSKMSPGLDPFRAEHRGCWERMKGLNHGHSDALLPTPPSPNLLSTTPNLLARLSAMSNKSKAHMTAGGQMVQERGTWTQQSTRVFCPPRRPISSPAAWTIAVASFPILAPDPTASSLHRSPGEPDNIW